MLRTPCPYTGPASNMAQLCDGFQDLVAALLACAARTRLALLGAHHDWLMCDISRDELASFIGKQQDLIAVLRDNARDCSTEG
jgi:hypothetical protein